MSDEWVHTISKRYIELYEKVTGYEFQPERMNEEEIYDRIVRAIKNLFAHR